MIVTETFRITGRGLVALVDQTTDLPVGHKLRATITRPDGQVQTVDAYKEWLLRRSSKPVEVEAFLLLQLDKSDVPLGSALEINVEGDEPTG